MSKKKLIKLLRNRAAVGRMEVWDKDLMRAAADELEAEYDELYEWQKKLFNALDSVIWYDGHYEWLKELRDDMEVYLKSNDKKAFYQIIFPAPEWLSEKHTIYMLLVGMFGDWGTSIRGGWIEDTEECIKFIDEICKHSWEAEKLREDNDEQREADTH